MAKGDRLLKDIYESLRAGPSWNKTLLAVIYDDAGGWYDQVVPPHIGVPNDAAPCNLDRSPPQLRNLSSKCSKNAEGKEITSVPFDFRRLGGRAAAMLLSPWVPKGSVMQHPKCSAKYKAADGTCVDNGRSHGTDQGGGAQFEHSSLPATIKSLFNLSGFLTERDSWAGENARI